MWKALIQRKPVHEIKNSYSICLNTTTFLKGLKVWLVFETEA